MAGGLHRRKNKKRRDKEKEQGRHWKVKKIAPDETTKEVEIKELVGVTWNTRKRPVRDIKRIISAIKKEYGDNAIVALQEVKHWAKSNN